MKYAVFLPMNPPATGHALVALTLSEVVARQVAETFDKAEIRKLSGKEIAMDLAGKPIWHGELPGKLVEVAA